MSRKGFTSALVAVLIAAVPATAFADGAGDDQYQDPLAAPTTPKKSAKKKTTTTAAPTATTTPAAAAPTSTTAGTAASGSSSQSSSQQQLPRTGAPAGLVGLFGAAMLAAGLALRRRTAE